MIVDNFRSIKYRVSESVYPTSEIRKFLILKLLQVQDNHVKRGIRQVPFPYCYCSLRADLNFVEKSK